MKEKYPELYNALKHRRAVVFRISTVTAVIALIKKNVYLIH